MADLKNIKDGAEPKAPKLTYEQLQAYAQQTVEQAKKIFQENQSLRQTLARINQDRIIEGLKLNLRCLDHAAYFSEEFIEVIVKRIENSLNPPIEEEQKEAVSPEEKEE